MPKPRILQHFAVLGFLQANNLDMMETESIGSEDLNKVYFGRDFSNVEPPKPNRCGSTCKKAGALLLVILLTYALTFCFVEVFMLGSVLEGLAISLCLVIFAILSVFILYKKYHQSSVVIYYNNLTVQMRSKKEVSSKVSTCWLLSLGFILLLSALAEIGCTFWILTVHSNWLIGKLLIGLSAVFLLTGLATLVSPISNRCLIITTIILAFASAVSASIIAFNTHFIIIALDLPFIRNDSRLAHSSPDEQLIYYPIFPLALMTTLLSSLPAFLVPISITVLVICVNLLVSIRLSNYQLSTKSCTPSFALFGLVLITCGALVIGAFNYLANLGFMDNKIHVLQDVKIPGQFAAVSYILLGFMSIITSRLQTVARKVILFTLALVIGLATLFMLWKTKEVYVEHSNIGAKLEKSENATSGIVIYDEGLNDTSATICFECLNEGCEVLECEISSICINLDKKCNGQLDFLGNDNVTTTTCLQQIQQGHYYDELDCAPNYIWLYLIILACGALVLVTCLAIWILTGSAVVSALCSHTAFV